MTEPEERQPRDLPGSQEAERGCKPTGHLHAAPGPLLATFLPGEKRCLPLVTRVLPQLFLPASLHIWGQALASDFLSAGREALVGRALPLKGDKVTGSHLTTVISFTPHFLSIYYAPATYQGRDREWWTQSPDSSSWEACSQMRKCFQTQGHTGSCARTSYIWHWFVPRMWLCSVWNWTPTRSRVSPASWFPDVSKELWFPAQPAEKPRVIFKTSQIQANKTAGTLLSWHDLHKILFPSFLQTWNN